MSAADIAAVLDTPRSLRARLGLRQADAADRADVSARTLTEIDAGRVSVRLVSVERVAKVLGVSAGALVDAMARERSLRRANKAWALHRKGRAK